MRFIAYQVIKMQSLINKLATVTGITFNNAALSFPEADYDCSSQTALATTDFRHWHGWCFLKSIPGCYLTSCYPSPLMLPWYTSLGIKFTVAPFSILGVAIAIFLGFRNNACYSRYVGLASCGGN